MIKFDIVTLFPNLFNEYLNVLPFKRALEMNAAEIKVWDLKKYSVNSYGSVDDKPYGGGKGMIIGVEPIYNALSDIFKSEDRATWLLNDKNKIILLSPRGKRLTQNKVRELSTIERAVLICGRYEGIDARVEKYLATDIISIGDFVLSGGESAATILMESIVRLLPGILDEEATRIESFEISDGNSDSDTQVEYPQYTRPEDFKGMKVPEVLLSGNHEEIRKWRTDTAEQDSN